MQNGEQISTGFDYRKCIGLKVKPRQGDGLLFYSVYPNGTIDPVTLHIYCFSYSSSLRTDTSSIDDYSNILTKNKMDKVFLKITCQMASRVAVDIGLFNVCFPKPKCNDIMNMSLKRLFWESSFHWRIQQEGNLKNKK